MLYNENNKKKEESNLVNSTSTFGIQTNFQNIRDFITKLKQFILDS